MVKRSRTQQASRACVWAIGLSGLAAVAPAPAGELRVSLDEIEAVARAWPAEDLTVSVAAEHERLAVQFRMQGAQALQTAFAPPRFGALGGRYSLLPETSVDVRLSLVRRPRGLGILVELPATARLRIVCIAGLCPSMGSLPKLIWHAGRIEAVLGVGSHKKSGGISGISISLGGRLQAICDTGFSLACPVLGTLLQPHLDAFSERPHRIGLDGIAAGPFDIALRTGETGDDVHFSFCLPAACPERSRDFPRP